MCPASSASCSSAPPPRKSESCLRQVRRVFRVTEDALIREMDSLAPPHPAPAFIGFLREESATLTHSHPCSFGLRPLLTANSFRRWASSLPLSRPHGLCLWQILFGISQMPQIPNCSSLPIRCGEGIYFLHFARKTFNPWAGLKTDSRSAAGRWTTRSVPDRPPGHRHQWPNQLPMEWNNSGPKVNCQAT
jgi:hypothetical protein